MAEETKIGIKLEEETKPIKKMCEKLMDAVNHELDKGIENIDTKELGEAIDMIKDLYEAKEKLVKSCYYKSVIEAMEEHDFEDEEEIMEDGRRGYRGQPRSQSGRFMSRGDGRRSNRGRRRGYESPMMMWDDDTYEWEDMEYMRDMDRPRGKMGYSGSTGGMSGSSSSGMGGQSSMGGSSQGGSTGENRGYSENNGGQYSSRMQGQNESRYDRAKRGYEETKAMHNTGSADDKKKSMESLENYMKELSEDMSELVGKMDTNEKNMLRTKLQTLAQKVQ